MFTIDDLKEELKNPEYQDKSYPELMDLLLQQKVPVLGAIAGADLRDVVTMLCQGIAFRLKAAPLTEGRVMLETAFDKMGIQNFQFNFAAPEVVAMLDYGVGLGFITPSERDKFHELATKQVPVWEGVTIRNLVECLDPLQIELNQWVEVGTVDPSSRWLEFQSVIETPEAETLIVEVSLSRDGSNWTNYAPCVTIPNIKKPNIYIAGLPSAGTYLRRLRWKSLTYKLNGVLTITP